MRLISNSAKETKNIGKVIAKNICPGDILCLVGQLGSGKTMLTKGIALGLNLSAEKVTSPSFVLIREYRQGRFPLYHFDLYRLNHPEDIVALGYEDYLYGEGVSVIEWAERLKYLLPREFLKIELSFRPGSSRVLKFSAQGKHYKDLLGRIHEDIGA